MMIFVPICASLLAGYAVIFVLQALGMFLITRLGARYLMSGECLSHTYFFLLSVVWFVTSLASGYVTYYLAPFDPYGPHVFCGIMAAGAAVLVFRNDRELPTHQPLSVTITLFVAVAAGYLAGDLLHLFA